MGRIQQYGRRAAFTAGLGLGVAALVAGCGGGGAGSATGAAGSGTSLPAAATSPSSGATSTSAPASRAAPPASSSSAHRSSSGSVSASASSVAAEPSSGMPRCTTASLRITVQGNSADMQGSHSSLQFTNTGSRACELTGAPGVSYVTGNSGRQVGKPAKRIVGHKATVLKPGVTASAGLFRSSAPQKTPSCHKISVRGLRIYPPDSRTAAYVASPGTACKPPLNGPYLRVGPILSGAHNAI